MSQSKTFLKPLVYFYKGWTRSFHRFFRKSELDLQQEKDVSASLKEKALKGI